ncbi:hypothetical protein L1785_22655, partial [Antribacter sp. KLBMP9083]
MPEPAPEPEPPEPAVEEPVAPAEPAPAPAAPESDLALLAPALEPIGILADTVGPGPDAGDITQPLFRAAHPDTYTTASPGTADTSNVQTQLTSNTQNRFFECGDTIIYFQIIPIAADAPS